MRGKLRHEGFHFFKDPKGITYIGRVKPQRFESIAHLTDQIQKIIVYLREHFGCTRKQLIAHFVPRPAPAAPASAPVPDPAAPSPASVQAEAQAPDPAPAQAEGQAVASAPAPEQGTPIISAPPVPSEEDRVLADLHWLIQDGYVVEFSNGRLWALADKPPQPLPPPTPASTAAEAPTKNASEAATATPASTEPAAEPPPSPEPAPAATEGGEPNSTAPASS